MEKDSSLDYEKILLKDPLFSKYSLIDVDEMDLLNLLCFVSNNDSFNDLKIIDSYCPECKKDTTFNSEEAFVDDLSDLLMCSGMASNFSRVETDITLIEELEKRCLFIRKFNCPREPNNSNHSQVFIFRVKNKSLIKVGQHPTLADLINKDIEKYKDLDFEIYSELNRAVGLATHGIGIGSFVYLRRIIEKHLLLPKLEELLNKGKVSGEQISKADFKGKIDLVKDELPLFLVENKKIYSILSKGIHELDEDQCREYFPILKISIEIILDEQIEKKERDRKNKIISNQINKINE